MLINLRKGLCNIPRRILSLALLLAICAALLPATSRQPAQAAPLAQGGYSGTLGDENDMYIKWSISGITNLDQTGQFWHADWAGGPITFSGSVGGAVPKGYVSYGTFGAHLTGENNSVSWPEEGTDGEMADMRVDLPFSFTYTPGADDTTWGVDASAIARKCGGVCGTLTVDINVSIPEPTVTPTPEFTATPEPSPTPELACEVTGRVLAPADLLSWVPGDEPIVEVLVELMQNGAMVGRTISQLPDGRFNLRAPGQGDYTLQTSLAHAVTTPMAFMVVHNTDSDPVKIETAPFTCDEYSPAIEKDIIFSADQGHTVIQGTAPVDRLPSLGLVYVYTQKAWQEAVPLQGRTLDLGLPYEIVTFDTNPDVVTVGAYADTPVFDSVSSSEASIHLSPVYSTSGQNLSTRTIYHEFGHCVQADLQGDLLPSDGVGNWHSGYINAITTPSWAEGFASFYSLLVYRDVEKASRPILDFNGWSVTFDFPYYMPWTFIGASSMEEYAVISLLWDLVDGVQNMTELEVSLERMATLGITVTQTLDASKPVMLYGDFVQMPTADLLKILEETTASDQGNTHYDHIYDVRQLYSVLKAKNIGSDASAHPGLSRLDELFIAHGFFADTIGGDLYYDTGEQIGYSANLALTVNAGTPEEVKIPERTNPLRRYPPPIPEAFLAFGAVDRSGAPAAVDSFEVQVTMAEPYEEYSYSFQTRETEPGKLLVMMPDPLYPAAVEIKAVGAEAESKPLTLTSEEYWTAVQSAADGAFMTHTFEMKPQRESPVAGIIEDFEIDQDTLLLIGGGCGCLLVLAVLLLIIFISAGRRKRRRRQTEQAEYRAPAYPDSAPPPYQASAPVYPPGPPPPPYQAGAPSYPPPIPRQPEPASYQPAQAVQGKAPGMVACPECGGYNLPDAHFCATCGVTLTPKPAAAVCPACGHENRAGARFCATCGRKMG